MQYILSWIKNKALFICMCQMLLIPIQELFLFTWEHNSFLIFKCFHSAFRNKICVLWTLLKGAHECVLELPPCE